MRHSHLRQIATAAAATLLSALIGPASSLAAPPTTAPTTAPAFWSWAPTPPMGWNSWDCFATTITEAQTKTQTDYMADHLKQHGWQYIVVDIQWYEPAATGFEYRKGAPLALDEFGRLLPAVNRFPSSDHDNGFKGLADYIHSRGLKFGIHLLRGIPRQAVKQNTPIQGTPFHAADIANTKDVCSWNGDMYGVDMTKPGAQAYYDSVFALIASWDVDFVKVDDLSRPYHQAEIEGIRHAIDKAGRPMVFSTSPGITPLASGAHVANNANMWRISDDFWDQWPQLLAQFQRFADWTPHRGPGHFPDADMLPLGTIDMGRRKTHFTPDEQKTMMTLWAIAKSPLMLGADLTKLDEPTLKLLTNDEVIAVNQQGENPKQLFSKDGIVAWVADAPKAFKSHASPHSPQYFAVFNTTDAKRTLSVPAKDIGPYEGRIDVWELWTKQKPQGGDLEESGWSTLTVKVELPPHGAALYQIEEWSPIHIPSGPGN